METWQEAGQVAGTRPGLARPGPGTGQNSGPRPPGHTVPLEPAEARQLPRLDPQLRGAAAAVAAPGGQRPGGPPSAPGRKLSARGQPGGPVAAAGQAGPHPEPGRAVGRGVGRGPGPGPGLELGLELGLPEPPPGGLPGAGPREAAPVLAEPPQAGERRRRGAALGGHHAPAQDRRPEVRGPDPEARPRQRQQVRDLSAPPPVPARPLAVGAALRARAPVPALLRHPELVQEAVPALHPGGVPRAGHGGRPGPGVHGPAEGGLLGGPRAHPAGAAEAAARDEQKPLQEAAGDHQVPAQHGPAPRPPGDHPEALRDAGPAAAACLLPGVPRGGAGAHVLPALLAGLLPARAPEAAGRAGPPGPGGRPVQGDDDLGAGPGPALQGRAAPLLLREAGGDDPRPGGRRLAAVGGQAVGRAAQGLRDGAVAGLLGVPRPPLRAALARPLLHALRVLDALAAGAAPGAGPRGPGAPGPPPPLAPHALREPGALLHRARHLRALLRARRAARAPAAAGGDRVVAVQDPGPGAHRRAQLVLRAEAAELPAGGGLGPEAAPSAAQRRGAAAPPSRA